MTVNDRWQKAYAVVSDGHFIAYYRVSDREAGPLRSGH